jgi:flagellar hook protein FlgE
MNVADSGSPAAANTIATATLNFDSNGLLMATSASTVPSSTAYDPTTGILSVTTGDGQNIGINVGSTGSTAGISQLDGSYQTTKIQTDGSSFGLMQSVSIGTDGIVTAAFSNGATRPIYQIDVAIVPNPDGLAPVSGDAYSLTPAAGVAQLYAAGTGPAGTTVGGSLEGSNVDLSTELTNLIATQRAYSSSATVIQTANAMLGTLTTLNQ